jgi:hypothetical protein
MLARKVGADEAQRWSGGSATGRVGAELDDNKPDHKNIPCPVEERKEHTQMYTRVHYFTYILHKLTHAHRCANRRGAERMQPRTERRRGREQ